MLHLVLMPRGGLFLKDGRGWYTSDVGRSYGHAWPLPPTVGGAIRAAYGRVRVEAKKEPDWSALARDLTIARPLALRRPLGADQFTVDHRLWPTPGDAFYDADGRVTPLVPVKDPCLAGLDLGQEDEDGAFAALWRPRLPHDGKPGMRPVFWCESEILEWLGSAPAKGSRVIPGCNPPRRTDIHVTIDPDSQTAEPAMLFSCDVTEPLGRASESDTSIREWGLAVACKLPGDEHADQLAAGPILLGGRRRMATSEKVSADLFEAPAQLVQAAQGRRGLRLLCVAPALFQRGWLPDGFERQGNEYIGNLPSIPGDVILRAAIVPRPLHLSTWNMLKREPRPTLRLVAPGSVYFFEKPNGVFSAAECKSLWLAAWGGEQENGLGTVIPGRWDVP